MKHVEQFSTPTLAPVLRLCLAACGNSDNVAGDDWRRRHGGRQRKGIIGDEYGRKE